MSGLAWWTIAGVAFLGWAPGFFLKESSRQSTYGIEDEETSLDIDSDAESVITLTPDDTVETVLSK
jgi:hypothetical protein